MNIEDSVIILKNIKKLVAIEWKHHITDTELSAIETLLTAYEKEKEERERIGKLYYEANENCIKYEKIIEKQSKEIEELKQEKEYLNCIIESDEDNYINKDKIKAKIEEINKEMLNEENSLELFYRKKYCKEVLQSLLDKE